MPHIIFEGHSYNVKPAIMPIVHLFHEMKCWNAIQLHPHQWYIQFLRPPTVCIRELQFGHVLLTF